MQKRSFVWLATVVAASVLLKTGWAMAQTPAPISQRNAVKNYVCIEEGDLILPSGSPPVATIMQTRGTLTMSGTNLANLTTGRFLLSITDTNPSAPSPGLPRVESCFYTTSAAIVYGGPPFPAGRFWTLAPAFTLDAADSGADCPNPLTSGTFLLALTHFHDDKLGSIVGTHFKMNTLNVPNANLAFTCQRQEVLPGKSVNWPPEDGTD